MVGEISERTLVLLGGTTSNGHRHGLRDDRLGITWFVGPGNRRDCPPLRLKAPHTVTRRNDWAGSTRGSSHEQR